MKIQLLPLLLLYFACITLQGCNSQPENQEQNATSLQEDSIYITAEEYLLLHPEQQKKSELFGKAVNSPATPIPAGVQSRKISIAIVYPGEQASDYWRRSLASFVARLDEIGIAYVVHEFFSKGGGVDVRKQEEQLKNALELNPDYLVFTLDVQQHTKIIERIISKRRPFLILQNITTPLRIWETNQPFYVGFDHAIGTRMLAEYFHKHSGTRGTYGLLYYSRGYVSTMRGDTFLDFMQQKGGPRLAGAFYTNGVKEQAKEATLNLLRENADLRFIYNCSTDVALGAAEGVREAGKSGKILLNGWGGGSAELRAILEGQLDVTVMRMNDDNGVAMAEAIRLRMLGQEELIPTVFSGQFTLVTRQSSEEELDRLKKRAFRYSGVNKNED